MSETIESLKAVRALLPLLKLLTVRQVIEAGDEAITACGLDPWCMNEGRAEGHERAISSWQYDSIRDGIDRAITDEETLRTVTQFFNRDSE